MQTGIELPFALRTTPTVRGAFLLGLKKGDSALILNCLKQPLNASVFI